MRNGHFSVLDGGEKDLVEWEILQLVATGSLHLCVLGRVILPFGSTGMAFYSVV